MLSLIIECDMDSSSEKLVLLSIAHHADKFHEAFPSVLTISAETCLNRKTVISCLKLLREKGFIEDTGRKAGGSKRTVVYRINLSKLSTRQSQNWDSPKNGIVPDLVPRQSQNWYQDSPKIGTLKIDRYIERDIGEKQPQPVDNFLVPYHVRLAMVCRENGIKVTSQHPTLIALAKENIDINLFTDAVKECVERAERPNINYVVSILKSWSEKAKEVEGIDLKDVKKPGKKLLQWWTSDKATQAKGEELGIPPRSGESFTEYRQRLFDEIHKQETLQ